jgi:hypothetical protein
MINPRNIALAAVLAAAALGCDNDKPPANHGGAGIGGITGTGGSAGGAANTIKLETWMDGIAKNGEVDLSAMPDNVLFTVTDKQPVSATQTAATPQDPGKLTVVYDEDPAALRFLLEADPRYEAP